ncbi:MAG: pantetheine-phosphate adenylyltransferase [Gammaproteobacteria bacterium]|nr:MAG: pantetheine-phosphate adenylyltransferase [Gammaproteobacteria bacterium]
MKAVYPGTFDPITHGHTDIVARACRLFPRVIVAITDNPAKHPAFTLEERLEMARLALSGFKNAEVCAFTGLLVDFVREQKAQVILRGLRAISDFEFEFQLASMNRHLAPGIETLFLAPDERYAFISSSLVREIAALGGDISPFVHEKVRDALYQKLR